MKKTSQNTKSSSKSHGRIYTPDYLVRIILDFSGYQKNILQKHLMDNSCGDGAFLVEAVNRYCLSFLQENNDLYLLKSDLETYIHGIEIDQIECEHCIENLNNTAKKFEIKDVKWDVICADTLSVTNYKGKIDYVVGNPPYVRVHNLESSYENVKQFSFAQGGMTDLFIVFFEIGFKMLTSNGTMCIITPSSWLSSKAGYSLRKYIIQNHNFSGAIDLEHYQAFSATTYTLISRFNQQKNDRIEYKTFDGNIKNQDYLKYQDFVIGKDFFLSLPNQLLQLKEIKQKKWLQYVRVKNGFATLADNVFIGDFAFSTHTIDVIKASTGKWQKCIFPYDKNAKPLTEKNFEKSEAYSYLLKHKDKLAKERDLEKSNCWFLFGRTQAINDVFKDKISINTIIKNLDSIKITQVESGKGVYSGLYILTDIPYNVIRSILISDEFINYLKMLKNYKSGGYYTFTSKDLELYLNCQLEKMKYEQPNVFTNSSTLF